MEWYGQVNNFSKGGVAYSGLPFSLETEGKKVRSVLGYRNIFSSVQSLSRVQLFMTPWTAACQASLSTTNSQSLLKLMSIESVMSSKHLILCRCLLLLPSIIPSIKGKGSRSVVSDSSWPHGLQPTRLLRPRDFPGKSTRVGCCHLLWHCV